MKEYENESEHFKIGQKSWFWKICDWSSFSKCRISVVLRYSAIFQNTQIFYRNRKMIKHLISQMKNTILKSENYDSERSATDHSPKWRHSAVSRQSNNLQNTLLLKSESSWNTWFLKTKKYLKMRQPWSSKVAICYTPFSYIRRYIGVWVRDKIDISWNAEVIQKLPKVIGNVLKLWENDDFEIFAIGLLQSVYTYNLPAILFLFGICFVSLSVFYRIRKNQEQQLIKPFSRQKSGDLECLAGDREIR